MSHLKPLQLESEKNALRLDVGDGEIVKHCHGTLQCFDGKIMLDCQRLNPKLVVWTNLVNPSKFPQIDTC
jgi:hypothetical protein